MLRGSYCSCCSEPFFLLLPNLEIFQNYEVLGSCFVVGGGFLFCFILFGACSLYELLTVILNLPYEEA